MLRLADLKIPSHTIRGQPVRLECHYDLEGEAVRGKSALIATLPLSLDVKCNRFLLYFL